MTDHPQDAMRDVLIRAVNAANGGVGTNRVLMDIDWLDDAESVLSRLASPAVSTEGGRSDSERLDWLDEQWAGVYVHDDECGSCQVQSNRDYTLSGFAAGGYNIREAIDAAMQSSVPNASEQSPPASPSEEGR